MLVAVIVGIVCSIYFYVEAFKHGLVAKYWAWAGFFLGPIILPLFSIKKHMAMRRASGFGFQQLKA